MQPPARRLPSRHMTIPSTDVIVTLPDGTVMGAGWRLDRTMTSANVIVTISSTHVDNWTLCQLSEALWMCDDDSGRLFKPVWGGADYGDDQADSQPGVGGKSGK